MRKGRNVAISIAIVAVLAGAVYLVGDLTRTRFDSAIWIASGGPNPPDGESRLEMADDLIRTRRLMGLTKDEVTKLLGPPSTDGYFSQYDLVYRLGIERSLFGVDSEWLVIRIDDQGRVIDYRLTRD